MPNLSVRENLFLNPLAAGLSIFSFLAPRRENRASLRTWPARRPSAQRSEPRHRAPVGRQSAESGRRTLAASCRASVYVFEDPTAGVDVGAKAEIYRLFDVALQAGAAIIIVSTDFEEVAKVCHRALVFDRGRVVAELGAADLSVENLLAAASASVGPDGRTRAPRSARSRAAMQSIKSNALEPTRSELAGLPRWRQIVRVLPVYGLPIITLFLIIFFSLLLPQTFPTYLNFRSILADKAIIALLSLAATMPMMAGRIDLTVGFGIVMWHILAIGLQVKFGVPWPIAILIVLACAAFVGLLNGILVEIAQIDSFIATLGTGTILYALALWFTDGRQIIGPLSPDFIAINTTSIAGIPIPAIYVIAAGDRPVDRQRKAAARPPHLRDRRQREGGGAERHSRQGLCRRGFRGVGTDRRLCRLHPRREAPHRPGQCRARLSAAGAGRRVSRFDDHQARPGECLGHDVRRSHPRRRHLGNPAARRRVLRRAAVQWHDAGHLHRARRVCAAATGGGEAGAGTEHSS